MSATDELRKLRKLLDERGVGWDYGITGSSTTRFRVNGVDLTFTPMRGGLVCSTVLTPEQAIAATLGPGTCKRVYGGKKYSNDKIVCSECGYGIGDRRFNYCPSCGCRIENTVEEYYDERYEQ